MYLSSSNLKELDRVQSKHLKCILLGLTISTHTASLLESLYVPPISSAVKLGAIKLLKSCLESNRSASSFYMHLLRTSIVKIEKTLFGHVTSFINSKNIS